MVTRWTQERLDRARSLWQAKRYRSALQQLSVIFDVYPDQPEAQEMASAIARAGSARTTDAGPDETIERRHLFDSRLDPIFSSCDTPGCRTSWISPHYMKRMFDNLTVTNPLGAGCAGCGVALCRKHLWTDRNGLLLRCPRCSQKMDPTSRPNGRSQSVQTPRLNRPLVHIAVLTEGRNTPSPEFMTELLQEVSPDTFEENPRVSAFNGASFSGDSTGLADALAFKLTDDYPAKTHEIHVYPGRQAGRRGRQWVIIKVFENRPKHVDPDNPEIATASSPSTVVAPPGEPGPAVDPVPRGGPVEQASPARPEQEESLLRKRIIYLGASVEEDLANRICTRLLLLDAEDPHRDIFLYINSPGGSVSAGMAIHDMMQYVTADVVTVALGLAAGTAQFVLCAGAPGKRYALAQARILMRSPSSGTVDAASDTESDNAVQAEQLLFTRQIVHGLTASHTGQSLEVIERDADRNRWYTAQEAKEYGMVDHVGVRPPYD